MSKHKNRVDKDVAPSDVTASQGMTPAEIEATDDPTKGKPSPADKLDSSENEYIGFPRPGVDNTPELGQSFPSSEPGVVIECPPHALTVMDHLEAAIALLEPMAKPTNPCLEQAYNLLTRHIIHLTRTGLKQ